MLKKIQDMISEQLGIEAEKITEETKFIDDLGCDSLDIVELTVTVQDEFNLAEIPEDDLIKLQSVGDLLKYVEANAK